MKIWAERIDIRIFQRISTPYVKYENVLKTNEERVKRAQTRCFLLLENKGQVKTPAIVELRYTNQIQTQQGQEQLDNVTIVMSHL